jgi:glutathione synthase/RimK-type ligase-like ATP-grasp enzyme
MTVGPIGILTFRMSPIRHLNPLRLRALLAEAALQEVDLRFFAAEDCDPVSGTVSASRWVRGAWEKAPIALPDLVLITTKPVMPEHHAIDTWLRRTARVLGFRERNKLEVNALVLASSLAPYVVPSERVDPDRPEAQLHEWLSGGGIVVKPSDGMRGIGIHFVVRDAGGWAVFSGDERRHGSAGEAIARVTRAIRGRLGYRDYLVQRYIDTRNELGQPVAIRVDIARLPEGGWGLIRMAGRIASTGKMVSNGARGGAYMPIESFLATRRVRPPEVIAEEALTLARGVADILIAQPGTTTYYECGVDLAIDFEDRLWFIEANPRPQAVGAEHERAILVIAYLKALAAA